MPPILMDACVYDGDVVCGNIDVDGVIELTTMVLLPDEADATDPAAEVTDGNSCCNTAAPGWWPITEPVAAVKNCGGPIPWRGIVVMLNGSIVSVEYMYKSCESWEREDKYNEWGNTKSFNESIECTLIDES